MSRADFESLLSERSHNEPTADWNRQRAEWLECVSELYASVKGFLKSYIDSGRLSVTESKKSIREDCIGTYDAPTMTIQMGSRGAIRFDPIGALIAAASGRVDMIGPNGSAMLVLVPETSTGPGTQEYSLSLEEDQHHHQKRQNPRSEEAATTPKKWKVATNPPNIRYLSLDEDRFFDLTVELVRNCDRRFDTDIGWHTDVTGY